MLHERSCYDSVSRNVESVVVTLASKRMELLERLGKRLFLDDIGELIRDFDSFAGDDVTKEFGFVT